MRARIFLPALLLPMLVGAQAFAGAITSASIVSNWTSGTNVSVGGNNGAWALSGTSVSSNGNRTGSLTSDFTAAGDYSFSTDITNITDNDLSGILFGFQDAANSYGLTWGGGGVGSFNGIQLFKEVAGVRTNLAFQGGNWIGNRRYNFSIQRTGSQIKATILDTVLNSNVFMTTVNDSTFLSGKVGFETWSQNATFGQGNSTDFTTNAVPEPTSLGIFGMIFGMLAFGKNCCSENETMLLKTPKSGNKWSISNKMSSTNATKLLKISSIKTSIKKAFWTHLEMILRTVTK